MSTFEKLGLFYLGKRILAAGQTALPGEETFLYDAKDLTTHGVCVGMTGSGKTGLCISLLEEAAIDNIPSIIIDPKGDMGNLLLTFPELRPQDFRPWVDAGAAQRKNMTVEAFAAQQAQLWQGGLAKWGQDGNRIRTLRQHTDLAIYTPGSSAGIPVSILDSFAAPAAELRQDSDLLNERIQTTVTGILGLLGIKADPLQSREHILLSNLFAHHWQAGQDLDLGGLIRGIQSPPFQQVGFFQLDSFYPQNERFKLAMAMNNLLAAPGFKSWLEGEPLDFNQLLYTADGRARAAIFSIAHLSDSERMFFVTLLLNQVLSWMRRQPGTTSLRALLYMDEVFGYLPPIGEPPSKKPLLTLLKQARAFGLGVMLATQNPVDLDYKGLSNAGTWFIGRLQTERDKERLIDGLMTGGADLNRQELFERISGLGKREFLVKNVHESGLEQIKTRWALSYLRGPLTRDQIKTLMENRIPAPAPAPAGKAASAPVKAPAKADQRPPQLPPEIRQYFAPATLSGAASDLVYRPFLIAGGDVHVFQNTYGIAQTGQVAHAIDLTEFEESISWQNARPLQISADLLGGQPLPQARFAALPAAIARLSIYNKLDKQYESFVYREYQLQIFKSPTYKLVSRPGESERDFRIRLREAARERRDLEMDRMRRKFTTRVQRLENQLLTAQQRVERESDQYRQRQMDTALSVGSSLLGAFLGGRRSRSGFTRAARSASRISKEKQDIQRAQEKLASIQERIAEVNRDFDEQAALIAEKFSPENEVLKPIVIRAKKSDVIQKYYGILWVPYGRNESGELVRLFQD